MLLDATVSRIPNTRYIDRRPAQLVAILYLFLSEIDNNQMHGKCMFFNCLTTAVNIVIFSIHYLKNAILKPSTGVIGLIICLNLLNWIFTKYSGI